jgi:preprotein translocase subunit SecD
MLREQYVEKAPDVPAVCSSDEDCPEAFSCSRGAAGGQCLPSIEMYLDNALQYSAPPSPNLYQTWKYGEDSKSLVVQTGTFADAEKVHIVLEAGRLPKDVDKLQVFSQDYIDPKLGSDFGRGALYAGLAAIVAVFLVVFIRYRKMKVVLPIIFVDVAELVIIIGFAAMIKWSLDLPAIAGMIAVLGTAVDQQIVITDQILSGGNQSFSMKKSVKTAFKIVVIAASTTIAAMLPLAYPGFTGLYALRGFAIVTILGVLIGLLITRPAFARMAEILFGEE